MAEVLTDAGIRFTMPKGAFYFFPQSPVPDDRVFIDALVKERVLAVPGSAFGGPGYFRMAFCVDEKVIRAAAPGIRRAALFLCIAQHPIEDDPCFQKSKGCAQKKEKDGSQFRIPPGQKPLQIRIRHNRLQPGYKIRVP